MNRLEQAIKIATKAHEGQVDKAGKPYILHPLRVMLNFTDEDMQIIAVLHDVLEDSGSFGWMDIEEFFGEGIADLILDLTHSHEETYFDYIRRIKANKIATEIKLADLRDNMDLSRLSEVTDRDLERNKRYEKAILILTS